MSYQTPQKERSEANDLTNLFQDYSSDMLTYARYRLGGLHNDMAEDIVQEAFLSLWKNMGILEKVPHGSRKTGRHRPPHTPNKPQLFSFSWRIPPFSRLLYGITKR